MRVCYCGKSLSEGIKYCSSVCQQKIKYTEYIDEWKNGNRPQIRLDRLSKYIQRYILLKYNNQCSRCGWHELHPTTGVSPLEINHVDGHFFNNNENNLELLCPNCHSLTPFHKHTGNHISDRNTRKEKLRIKNRSKKSRLVCLCGNVFIKLSRIVNYKKSMGQQGFYCSRACATHFSPRNHKYDKIILAGVKLGWTGYQIAKENHLNRKTVYDYLHRL